MMNAGRRGLPSVCECCLECLFCGVNKDEGFPCCYYPYTVIRWCCVRVGRGFRYVWRRCLRPCCLRLFGDPCCENVHEERRPPSPVEEPFMTSSTVIDRGIPPPRYSHVVSTTPTLPVVVSLVEMENTEDGPPQYHQVMRGNSLPSYEDAITLPTLEEEDTQVTMVP